VLEHRNSRPPTNHHKPKDEFSRLGFNLVTCNPDFKQLNFYQSVPLKMKFSEEFSEEPVKTALQKLLHDDDRDLYQTGVTTAMERNVI
jgi:hypothetical protein